MHRFTLAFLLFMALVTCAATAQAKSVWVCVSSTNGQFQIFGKDEGFSCLCVVRTPARNYSWHVSAWAAGFGCKGYCLDSAKWGEAKSFFKERKDSGNYWAGNTNSCFRLPSGAIGGGGLMCNRSDVAMYDYMNKCQSSAWSLTSLQFSIPDPVYATEIKK